MTNNFSVYQCYLNRINVDIEYLNILNMSINTSKI